MATNKLSAQPYTKRAEPLLGSRTHLSPRSLINLSIWNEWQWRLLLESISIQKIDFFFLFLPESGDLFSKDEFTINFCQVILLVSIWDFPKVGINLSIWNEWQWRLLLESISIQKINFLGNDCSKAEILFRTLNSRLTLVKYVFRFQFETSDI